MMNLLTLRAELTPCIFIQASKILDILMNFLVLLTRYIFYFCLVMLVIQLYIA